MRSVGVRRFVYTSSTSVYGHALVPDGRGVWVTESLTPQPRDVYDETKLAAERLIGRSHDSQLSTVALRVAGCFPESYGIRAVHRLYRGASVDDVARAHVLALEEAHVDGVLNIAGPYPFEEGDAGPLWANADGFIGRRFPEIATLFGRAGLVLPRHVDRVYDSSRARERLGYLAEHGVEAVIGAA